MDRDSAEASLLAEVIAAEVEAARRDSGVGRAGDDVEREMGRVANVLDMLHASTSRFALSKTFHGRTRSPYLCHCVYSGI